MTRLGVNIDHVATLRQARKEGVPNVVQLALAATQAGAQGITAHLREDRRHIQDGDLYRLKASLPVPLNMEMAATADIISVALDVAPPWVCLVPEKRQELTTEGGLNVSLNQAFLKESIQRLKSKKIQVSLFIEPESQAVQASKELCADAVELHTGTYAKAVREGKKAEIERQLGRLAKAAKEAEKLNLVVNAGHGLTYDNVEPLLKRFPFHEFNIGFSIICRALEVGLERAVREMKDILEKSLCAAS